MNTYIESFLELLYPEKNTCFFCDVYDESIGDKYICPNCQALIKKNVPPSCSKCSKPIGFTSSTNLCPDCSSYENHFEMSKSPFAYEGIIKNGIYNFKYYNKPYFYKFFGNCIFHYMESIDYLNFDYILPVPLHSSKIRKRGYNQSELLAKYLAAKSAIPFVDPLKRTKETPKQSEQSKEERRKNLKNAFIVKTLKSNERIKNRTVLLVDDVYTTGSTADECSKALLDYGVGKVYVITIAR
ncbi:MAG: ComF family protein [Sedimentibacter sp.]